MNIAIIVGVSEYSDSSNNLPGCSKDADIIYNLIGLASKYDEVLYVNQNLTSSKVKEKITDFISIHKNQTIDELFFYFTGHGEYSNDEFFYILSDYNSDKKNQTSLQNTEVDNLFKSLNPNLVIKVIDACQSGKSYIKEHGAIVKHFKTTIDRFNHCYFLSSSLKDQSSFQSDSISDFTFSFVEAVRKHDTSEIRFKDIIDYISDEFEGNTSQTPFFIVQADYTEKFCVISSTMKTYLESLSMTNASGSDTTEGVDTLIEKIRQEATEYLTKAQAMDQLGLIRDEIESLKLSTELNDIYELQIVFQDNYAGIIQHRAIGKWLEENKHDLFAKAKWTKQLRQEYLNPSQTMQVNLAFMSDDDKYELVITDFEMEVEVPYKSIVLTLRTKYPNVESYTARIIYFLSRNSIRVFYFVTNINTINWDVQKINSNIKWSTFEEPLVGKSDIVAGIKNILQEMERRVFKELEEKYDIKETLEAT